LTACLPALYEAKTANKTSVHPDVSTNPLRGAAYILQKSINNYSKKREYPMQLMLASLLGLHQFSSSHTFQFVPANIARKVAFDNIKLAGSTTLTAAVLSENDSDDLVVEEDMDEHHGDANAFPTGIGGGVRAAGRAPGARLGEAVTRLVEVSNTEVDSLQEDDNISREPSVVDIDDESFVDSDEEFNRARPDGDSNDATILGNLRCALDLEDIAANGQLVVTRKSTNSGSGNNKVGGVSSSRQFNVSVVSLLTDYQARGDLLKDLNFQEFCLLISKTDKPGVKSTGVDASEKLIGEEIEEEEEMEEERGEEDEDDADSEDVFDDCGYSKPVAESISCCGNDPTISTSARINLLTHVISEEEGLIRVGDSLAPSISAVHRKRGPARNGRFPIQHTNRLIPVHPQMDKKEFMIRSKIKVPVITGKHVPQLPKKDRPDEGSASQESVRQWDKQANDWASFYICLLVPWDLESGFPPYDMTYDGIFQFIGKYDSLTNIEREDPVYSAAIKVHAGRLRYLENCAIAGHKNNDFEKARSLLRRKTADNKTFCDLQHRMGARCGQPIAGDSSIDAVNARSLRERDEQANTDYMSSTVRDLRDIMEYNVQFQDDVVNVQRIQDAQALFGQSLEVDRTDTAGNVPDQIIISSPDETSMKAVYEKMTKFKRPTGIESVVTANVSNKQFGTRPKKEPSVRAIYETALNAHMPKVKTLKPSQRKVYDEAVPKFKEYFKWENSPESAQKASRQPPQYRVIIQGGPGSGKTYLMNIIVERFLIESRLNDASRGDTTAIGAPTAAASKMYPTGKTIHYLIGMLSKKNNATFLRDLTNDKHGILELLLLTLLLVLDEMSMITKDMVGKVDERFRSVKQELDEFFGKIPFVFIVGDFRQLGPGVGGVKSTIMYAIIKGKKEDPFNNMLRTFRRKVLIESPRAEDDAWQQKLVHTLNNVTYPITADLLRESCEFCLPALSSVTEEPTLDSSGMFTNNTQRRYPIPHAQCTHLHYLNPTIVRSMPELVKAPVIYPGHLANDSTMLSRLKIFAEYWNVPVLRWPLPAASEAFEEDINAMHADGTALHFPQLFGYYVQGLPVKINFNASQEVGVVNGTSATLHALCPFDYEGFERHLAIVRQQQPDNSLAGVVIDIATPLGVYLTCPTAYGEFSEPGMVCLLSIPSGVDKIKRDKPPVNVSISKKHKKVLRVYNPGYNSGLGGTPYVFQGETLFDGNGVDVNFSLGNPLTLAFLVVALTRVKESKRCFLMPFCKVKNPFEKLLLLRHPDEWFIWNNAYDSDGVFQWSLVKPIEELISLTPPGARQKSVRPLIVKKNKQNLVTTVPQPLSILAPPRVQLTIDELLSSNVARMPPPQGGFQQLVTKSVPQPVTSSVHQQPVAMSPINTTTAIKRKRIDRGDATPPSLSFDFTTTTETLSGMVASSSSSSSSSSSGSGSGSGGSSAITQQQSKAITIDNEGTCFSPIASSLMFNNVPPRFPLTASSSSPRRQNTNGIENLGNTCYLAVVVQVIIFYSFFASSVLYS
jgi:hypothetical protein